MFLRRVTLLLGVVLLGSACGAVASGSDATTAPLEIGELPTGSSADVVPTEPTLRSGSTIPYEERIGSRITGNRVLMIGDSVMASTSRRYSNDMCEVLVPLGWQVEVEAETGQFSDFGLDVLDAREGAGWDAAVILLGNNYRGDPRRYRDDMEEMVQRLSPSPVVLLTVTEFTSSRRQVNDAIRSLEEQYQNVMVVDWAGVTADDRSLTGNDGLHLTDRGRTALAMSVAAALGQAPQQPGDCLRSEFTDDSRGSVTGTNPSGNGGNGGNGGTTVQSTTPSTESTAVVVTDPPATDPPPPPPTDPPITLPPTSVASGGPTTTG